MRTWKPAVLAMCLLGCDNNAPPSIDLWERQRVCGERADRMAESMRQEINSQSTQMGLWQSHYNRSTERCYVLIDQYNLAPGAVPYTRHTLWDAFERRPIARFADEAVWDEPRGAWCNQTSEDDKRETTSATCKEVAAYVARLMRE